jgi:hypothetical protein
MSKKQIKEDKIKMTSAEKLACMKYLHGIVPDEEYQAARDYEYARESDVLWQAARMVRESGKCVDEVLAILEHETYQFVHVNQWPWMALLTQCPSFPEKSYNQLTDPERKELRLHFTIPSNKVRPLPMHRLTALEAMDVFNDFRTMAAKLRDERSQNRFSPPFAKDEPVMHVEDKSDADLPFFHALFLLDFRKDRSRMKDEFDAWLQLPQNKARFEKYKPKIKTEKGTANEAKDRLKDLAAWRLERTLGWKAATEYVRTHRLKDTAGRPRPFMDARTGQTEKTPRNDAPLYGHESGWSKAKARAKKHRAELFPWEYGVYAQERAKQDAERREWIRSVAEARKISERNP